ncbi:MAG TPA: hypothetical protein ENH23_05070 [candidate division Zixibacteria bacterium]|nr:hypothetical protein [candidate division Zixibacteria bacterium]
MTVIIFFLLTISVTAQETEKPEQFGLNHLTEYLSLKPSDISFRADYTEPDSFRLQIVTDLMQQPLGMINYIENLKNSFVKKQPGLVASYLFQDLKKENQTNREKAYFADISEIQKNYNLYYTDMTLNQLLTRAAVYLDVVFPRSIDKSLAFLTKDEKKFLTHQFKELLVQRVEDEFLSVEAMDSLDKVEEAYIEQFIKFASKIDKDPIIDAGISSVKELMLEINNLRQLLKSKTVSSSKILSDAIYLPDNADLNAYLGRQSGWKIGGTGNDYYSGDYKFILDFGGDDVYDLSYDPDNPHGVIIIDLSGNDTYRSQTDFTLGSGCLSVGLLFDFDGNDRYDAKSFSIGSGFFGMGMLYDVSGDDRYDGDTHVQGAGSFGLGLLIDESGRDIYNAALYSQGFGFIEGLGAIFELNGADSYYAGGKYKDILRYDDHYLSLSQGFGYGLRPYASGGIGAIVDIEGNDTYYSDIFAQAASYWWSLVVIYDSTGNDNYNCFQYGQGCGTHMTLGGLIDEYGNDVYFGKGLMQGVGHDYSFGLILDRHGNDTYTATDLSQGAGSANGAGVLIDNEGDDRYFIKNKKNTQGYGNPRRDFGSIGLFIDLSGKDQYFGNGQDNFYWKTNSKWGGGMDIETIIKDSSEVSNEK